MATRKSTFDRPSLSEFARLNQFSYVTCWRTWRDYPDLAERLPGQRSIIVTDKAALAAAVIERVGRRSRPFVPETRPPPPGAMPGVGGSDGNR